MICAPMTYICHRASHDVGVSGLVVLSFLDCLIYHAARHSFFTTVYDSQIKDTRVPI